MSTNPPADRETIRRLIETYDRPGPRYTSYPTAVEFSESVGPGDYEERLRQADALGEAPLALYFHLPFCEERCLFCGCHVIITKHHDRTESYLDLLKREIDLVAARLPRRRKFAQLHLGGGTPTYFPPDSLRRLVEAIVTRFRPLPRAELAVEVDPRVTSAEHIEVLADVGFNRVSMGVQDFTPEVQARVHRIQSLERTRALVEQARRHGYSGINIDLIYGLPLQTPRTFEETVDRVIDIGVDRVACYSFAYVPWLQGHQKKLEPSELPARDIKLELLAVAREKLLRAGYEPIGMDHFARPDDELTVAKREGRLRRNFQGYAVIPGDDVLGFGISAIGDVRGALVQNEKKLSRYSQAVEHGRLPTMRGSVRSRDDVIRADVIHRLMCNFVIDIPSVEKRWSLDFHDYFRRDLELLAPLVQQGLAQVDHEAVRTTPMGELFVRNLAMCFDRYMRDKHANRTESVFSRTV